MAKKELVNQTHVEGVLYQHSLEEKVTGPNSKNPGTPFITGSIDIATDNEMTNIISIHYTYVAPTFGNGKENAAYKELKDIINGTTPNVMAHGLRDAKRLRVDSAFALNEFYSNRNGQEELVSVKRNEGGFIHAVSALVEDETKRNTFTCDMVITNTRMVENNDTTKMIIKGAIFDFRRSLLPVEFSVIQPSAIAYFENCDISPKNPLFTKVRGNQVSEIVIKRKEEPSAFGDPIITEYKSTRKDYVVNWAAVEPYIWDDESTLLASELTEMMVQRETNLAAMKARQDEWRNSRNAAFSASNTVKVAPGVFNF